MKHKIYKNYCQDRKPPSHLQSPRIVQYTTFTFDLFQLSFLMSYIQEGFVLKFLAVSKAVLGGKNNVIEKNNLDFIDVVEKY